MTSNPEPETPAPAATHAAAERLPAGGQSAHAAVPMPVQAAHLPADQGLSGLGILMDLGGSIFAFVWLFAAVIAGIAALAGGGALWLDALFLVLSVIRASLQVRAGRAIIAGHASGALTPLRKYVKFGLAHAASAVLLLSALLGVGVALLIGAALALWPAVMIVLVLRTPIARTAGARGINDEPAGSQDDLQSMDIGEKRYTLPLPGDNGYESLAVLMFLLAAISAVGLLIVIGVTASQYIELLSGSDSDYYYLSSSAREAAQPSLWLMVLLAVLAVRSGFHLRAAVAGLRGATTASFEEAATRYANMGVYAACASVVCVVIATMADSQSVPMGGLMASAILVFWSLYLWPRIVGQFVRERSLTEILARDHGNYRAEDKGLTALGWLLLALGLFEVTMLLRSTGIIDFTFDDVYRPASGGPESMLMLVALPLLSGAAKIFAGIELVRMTARFKLAAWVFAVVGMATALIGNWEGFRRLGSLGVGDLTISNLQVVLTQVGGLTLALLLPITTLVLIRRTDNLPGAQATFRR